ncbi:hypothetical protein M3Y98_00893100 [Aphelenchoides besseyi]|nr:hypothetical protein M3Y98_00893100 [Aphelenchoides besseyi]KAI6193014.1 hypothetical protein M3Y96_00973200 [Aphelenchoides besseyi]
MTEFRAQLDIVQLRANQSAAFNCKVLPFRSKAQTENFDSLHDAINYLRYLTNKTQIQLLIIQYVGLDLEMLNELKRLTDCTIADISITGCDFDHCVQQTFIDVFLRGPLQASRFNITRLKGLHFDFFDDCFVDALGETDVKMLAVNFCFFAEAERSYIRISESCLLKWLLEEDPRRVDRRCLTFTELKLDSDFATKVVKRFFSTRDPRPVTLVVAGNCDQAPIEGVASLDRRTAPCARIQHPNEKVHLRIGNYSNDRVEFVVCVNEKTDEA